ncbi:MAG TPA: sigma 54-interacting transcriptional regulator, partial [Vicinamibacterales bacterium]|nr:sigma 54-interacting transcriptional regulator [Vicinamibacterales bacterium]
MTGQCVDHGGSAAGPTASRAGGVIADDAGRRAIARLVEVFETGVPARPRAIQLALPADARRPLFLKQVAREARLHGYVPVSTAVFEGHRGVGVDRAALREALADRHVLLLHDTRQAPGRSSPGLFLVGLGISNSRPHVLALLVDADEAQAPAVEPRASCPRGLRARERPPLYLPEGPRLASPERDAAPLRLARSAAAPADVGVVRARAALTPAARLATSGRHAAAERLLRESLGALTRRGDDPGSGWAATTLGALLLLRGRAQQAAALFETARQHFDRAGAAPAAARSAVYVALAWTDLGRLEEAEAAARAAGLAAREMGDGPLHGFASVALARCLYWQERFADGLEALQAPDALAVGGGRGLKAAEDPAPFEIGGRPAGALPGAFDPVLARACLAARLSLAAGDLSLAGRAAAEARARAAAGGDPTSVAAAACALTCLYGAIGDTETARRAYETGLDAARRAHEPLRALRLRIAWIESLAHAGQRPAAASFAAPLARLKHDGLPWVVRRPLQRALQVVSQRAPARRGIRPAAPCGQADGIGHAAAPPALSPDVLLNDVGEVLALCQAGADEAVVVASVVTCVRRRHHLAALACLAIEDGRLVTLAAEGPAPVPEGAARRAVDLVRPLGPDAFALRNEAAVPVLYAGAVVGALAGRWAADVVPDWPRTGAVLSAAAAALGPCVRAALDRRAADAASRGGLQDEILGVSAAAEALRREVARAAAVPFSVVIEGESGTGKELVARALHQRGPRRHRKLCALNCAALSDELFEAELFGHARGAFTGAVAERKGLFEEADGGTLVLDEVGELTPRAQAKLLRAIQEGEIRRIGENFARTVDVRVAAASNRPLRAAVEDGQFRRDLLYRLDVVRIVVPPLRDRIEDVPVLAAHFWRLATERLCSRATLAPATVTALARYGWPGNIRELQNVIAALAVTAGKRGSVGPSCLPAVVAGGAGDGASTLEQARALFEARYVRAALARTGGHRAQAARELGVTRQGLAKLLTRLAIQPVTGHEGG